MTTDGRKPTPRPMIKPALTPEPIAFKAHQAGHVPAATSEPAAVATEPKPALATAELSNPIGATAAAAANTSAQEHDLAQLGKAGFAALSETNQILVAGFTEFMDSQAAAAKASVDETLSAISSLTSARTFQDILDIQSGLLKSNLRRSLENHRLITAASVRVTTQAFEPIKARIAAVTSGA